MQKQKRSQTIHHKRRSGTHHSHSKHYLKVYWPYVPMALIVAVGLVFGNWQPTSHNGVLAYATQMSVNTLLSSTNSERQSDGKASLSLSSKLNSAAQAKANDMVARDYWSHNTPDGNPPWTFMDAAGYDYLKAGENLAYGFDTSADTITGWMNSPGHRANMLDGSFTEVGFGFANSSNFNGDGPETVVVAMYGQPQVQSAQTNNTTSNPTATQPTATPKSTSSTPKSTSSKPAANNPAPSSTPAPAAEQPAPAAAKTEEKASNTPVTTAAPITSEPKSVGVSKIQTLSGMSIPWITLAIGIMSGAIVAITILRHGLAFRRLAVEGEEFVLHHPWADITLIALVMIGYVLSQTAGLVK